MHFSTLYIRRFFTLIFSLCLISISSFTLSAQVVLNTNTIVQGEEAIQVEITADNFDNIVAMQFTINWDPSVLSYIGLANNDSNPLQLNNGNFNVNLVEQGELPVAWVTPNLQAVSVQNREPIITLLFEVLAPAPTEIFFDNSPTPIEFIDGQGIELNVSSNTNTIVFDGQILEGRVFSDTQMDCVFQENEEGLNRWILEINNGENSQFVRTDETGLFRKYLSPGTYTVRPILPDNRLWSLCELEKTITITEGQDEPVSTSFGAVAVVDCPAMNVDVSTAFLRRCFENIYRVDYCNQGTAAAEEVHIVLNLPEELSIVSSPIPYTDIGNGDFQFDIGTVPFNTCSGFALSLLLDCESTELGQTHCVEANIFPQMLCDTESQLWSGASLDIKSTCDGDSVRFDIENVGEGDMEAPQPFLVIEDMIIMRTNQAPIDLDSGGKTSITFPANGSTYRLAMKQIPNHPTSNNVSAAIEGCGQNPQGSFSTGIINMFTTDDESDFTDVDCQENIGAFDPNDKTGYPTGYGDNNYIDQNQKMTYHIRFQNTGTDTAFNVVVLDTLTEHLEVASLQLLSSSHEYTLEILEENILQFSFNDILLVDSVKNEPLSHGYIRFEIDQNLDVPLGTVLNNSAAIFFDFNEPVITNVTAHTLGEEFIEVELRTSIFTAPLYKMSAQPNPFANATTITIDQLNQKDNSFFLYDLQGRLVKQQDFIGNQFELQRQELLPGMYLFKVQSNGQVIGNGKLIIKTRE